MEDVSLTPDMSLKWHDVAIRKHVDLSPGDIVPVEILSKEFPETPIILGRNPDTQDFKYNPQRSKFEVHLKLIGGTDIPRRSLKLEKMPSGACLITNLSDINSAKYGFTPNRVFQLPPGERVVVGNGQDVRNFWIQPSEHTRIKAQQLSATGNAPLGIDTFIFEETR